MKACYVRYLLKYFVYVVLVTQYFENILLLVTKYLIINHFNTTAHYNVWLRQVGRPAFVTSYFKIFLTQTYPLCGATCYVMSSRAMAQLFNGVNFVYCPVEVY